MYLLDTDTVIYSLKDHAAVKKNLLRCFYDPIKINVITVMELYYGAYNSQKIESNLAKNKKHRKFNGNHSLRSRICGDFRHL